MAFTVTARHSGNTGSVSTPTEASDSQTPTASSLLLTFFGAENNFHTQVIGRSISGGSLTYTAVDAAPADGLAGYAFDTDATFAAGAALYRADVGGSPSAFTITVDQWATANDGAYAVLSCDVTGHSSSTPVQTKSFGTAITLADHPTGTLTLTSTPTVGNLVVVGLYATADSGGAFAAPTIGTKSMTQLFNQNNSGFTHAGLWYRVWDGTESSNVFTCTDLGLQVGSYIAVAVEVAGAGGGPPVARTKAKVYNRAALNRASTR
jgi:hypothetical protein